MTGLCTNRCAENNFKRKWNDPILKFNKMVIPITDKTIPKTSTNPKYLFDTLLPKRNMLCLSISTWKKHMTQHGNMAFKKKTSLIWEWKVSYLILFLIFYFEENLTSELNQLILTLMIKRWKFPQGNILSVSLFSIKIHSLVKVLSDNIEATI